MSLNPEQELKDMSKMTKALDKVKKHEQQFLRNESVAKSENMEIKKRMGMDLFK